MGKLTVLLGGARSGKSSTAERMAWERGGAKVLFVATAQAFDAEMTERIAAHRAARPAFWETVEAPTNLAAALIERDIHDLKPPTVVVIDCLTLLANNVLLTLPEDCSQAQATSAIVDEVDQLLKVIQRSGAEFIVVTNEVGMGIVPAYRLGRVYRDALGKANQQLALHADEVLLLVAGIPWRLK